MMYRPTASFKISTMQLCLLFTIILQATTTYAYLNIELYEGSSCDLEGKNEKGECVLITQCLSVLEQVKRGERRASDENRCGFKGRMEIVCCPFSEISKSSQTTSPGRLTKSPKSTTTATTTTSTTTMSLLPQGFLDSLRAADQACQRYEERITGESTGVVHPHITNGERAAFGEFPYMVALGYKRDDDPVQLKYICGGTLIEETHVLTAAHCVSNIDNLVPVEVKLGAITLNNTSDNSVQNIKVKRIIHHPSYRRSLNYFDIAIIELQDPVNISKTVMPICLQTKPISNLPTLASLDVLVTGWGATSFENDGSNDLQKTPTLSIVENSECRKSYDGFSKLPHGLDDSMVCVLDKNMTRSSDACQGDSGGPLLLKGQDTNSVIGITSFGQSCGSRIPAVYTSVYYYIDWIEDIVWPKKPTVLK